MRARARAIGLALSLAGCTFPSAEYDGACDVPEACVAGGEPQACGDDARTRRQTCLDKSCGSPQCKAACETTFDDDIAECNHQCQICAKEQGCSNASAGCSELVGQ